MNLYEIKDNIIKFVESGECVDHVIDITTSNLSDNQKIHLTELFEEDMINQVCEVNNSFGDQINGTLEKVLKSRLFVYPEPETTFQQDVFNEKLDNDTYTAEDFHEQIFHHSKSPLILKAERWENDTLNGFGGMIAIQNDLVQKRNNMIYCFSDKLAKNINKNNIDVGIYISDIDNKIVNLSSECDILCGMNLQNVSHFKNILIWDSFTTAKNYGKTTDKTFGRYKLSCKLQWDLSNKSVKPCFGSVQIDECEDKLKKVYYPVFTRSFDNIKNLETHIELMYNNLHDIRETTTLSY